METQWVNLIETQSLKGPGQNEDNTYNTQPYFPVGFAVWANRIQRQMSTYCSGWQGDLVPKNSARLMPLSSLLWNLLGSLKSFLLPLLIGQSWLLANQKVREEVTVSVRNGYVSYLGCFFYLPPPYLLYSHLSSDPSKWQHIRIKALWWRQRSRKPCCPWCWGQRWPCTRMGHKILQRS